MVVRRITLMHFLWASKRHCANHLGVWVASGKCCVARFITILLLEAVKPKSWACSLLVSSCVCHWKINPSRYSSPPLWSLEVAFPCQWVFMWRGSVLLPPLPLPIALAPQHISHWPDSLKNYSHFFGVVHSEELLLWPQQSDEDKYIHLSFKMNSPLGMIRQILSSLWLSCCAMSLN